MKSQLIRILVQIQLLVFFFSSNSFGQKGIFNDSIIKISGVGINSVHSDFGPCVIKDSLFFTTFNDRLAKSSDLQLKKKEFYDLYKAKIDKNGNPISEREPVEAFITKFNDGPVSWCEKTGELFITQNDPNLWEKQKGFQKEIVRLKIVIAKKVNGKWNPVTDFPYNSNKYSVGHPSINESGDTLIFTSDIPGGFGQTDLYYSVRKNGKWGLPVNLGPRINTSGRDEFPYLTDQQQNGRFLIFASNGRFGDGGLDLYYTRFSSSENEVEHFSSPINTSYDDFSMSIPVGANYGYLTSNRPGEGDDDIYKFTFNRVMLKPVNTSSIHLNPVQRSRELFVFDKSGMQPIPGVKVISCDNQTYFTDLKGKISTIPADINNCEVIASAFGYSDQKKKLLSMGSNPIMRDTIWMTILTGQKIVLHNIYYDFDRYEILAESANELDRLVTLMKQNPTMRVELSSHTDSRGSEAYNLRLSELRAQAAADYLILKGIARDRITSKGYGKSQLIHKCIEPCSPAQQRENRRTELYIPEFSRSESVEQRKGDYFTGEKSTSSVKEKVSLPHNSGTQMMNIKDQNSSEINVKHGDSLKSKYYIILGSYKEKANAEGFLYQLQGEGYKAVILGETEPVRVGIGYDLLSQAKESLTLIRTKYQSAWILINH